MRAFLRVHVFVHVKKHRQIRNFLYGYVIARYQMHALVSVGTCFFSVQNYRSSVGFLHYNGSRGFGRAACACFVSSAPSSPTLSGSAPQPLKSPMSKATAQHIAKNPRFVFLVDGINHFTSL